LRLPDFKAVIANSLWTQIVPVGHFKVVCYNSNYHGSSSVKSRHLTVESKRMIRTIVVQSPVVCRKVGSTPFVRAIRFSRSFSLRG